MGVYTNSQNAAICIGRGVPAGNCVIDNLFVSPSGEIVIAESAPHEDADYAAALQQWSAEDLDRLAEDYSYNLYGQAFRIIDLMAKEGLLTFRDGGELKDKLTRTLANGSYLVLLSDKPQAHEQRRCSRRELIYQFSEQVGVDPDKIVEFMQEVDTLN